jgi:Ni,Fe-hydrogenase III small subunit/ferredoxin
MSNVILERLRQGHRTIRIGNGPADLPERYRGRPKLDPSKCPADCRACVEVCPTRALTLGPLRLDLGACLFCGLCQTACAHGVVDFQHDQRLATRLRDDLVISEGEATLATALDAEMKRLFGRSLKLRQVSAGGCNGCEADTAVTGIVVYDLGRFGIQFVASPRHADGIVVTGPVTPNMEHALRETYAAVPAPKIVIALGACAISGGLFATEDGTQCGIPKDIPVDLYIPGCPPHPLTIIDGLLRMLGRLDGG